MDKMPVMLEMKEGLLLMFRTIGKDWYYLWTPLKKLVTQARLEEFCFLFPYKLSLNISFPYCFFNKCN